MSSATIAVPCGSLRSIGEALSKFPRGENPDYKNEDSWKSLDENTMAHNAEHFLISCGTITLKSGFRDKKGQPEVLVTCKPHLYEACMLPKGRKDIHDDSLWTTARRETLEDTTIAVRPLYLKSLTAFTVPSNQDVRESMAVVSMAEGSTPQKNKDLNEIIGKDIIFSYAELDPKYGVRYAFFYPAQGDGEIKPASLTEENKGSRVQWLPIDEAIKALKVRVEREAVMRMKTLLQGMTEKDWKVSDELSGQET